jgi:hypothetical protein
VLFVISLLLSLVLFSYVQLPPAEPELGRSTRSRPPAGFIPPDDRKLIRGRTAAKLTNLSKKVKEVKTGRQYQVNHHRAKV